MIRFLGNSLTQLCRSLIQEPVTKHHDLSDPLKTAAQQVLSATLNLTSRPQLLPSVARFILNVKFLAIDSTSSIVDLKSLFLFVIQFALHPYFNLSFS